jgi:Membrane-associated phospholipid phosphatase
MFQKSLLLILFLHLFFYIAIGQNIDINTLRRININRDKSLDGTFRAITNSAAPISVGMPVGMLGIGLIKKDSAMVNNAIVLETSVLTSAIMTVVMKNIAKRPRPFVSYPDIEKITSGGGYSFPSGHTSGAFAFATSLSIDCPKWYVILPSYIWASSVAYSRMDLGVHYPSDILMGAIVGTGSAYLCHYLNNKLFIHNAKSHR